MARLIIAVRFALLMGWTFLAYGLWALVGLPLRPFVKNEMRPYRRWCVKFWGWGILHILGARLSIEGRPPKGPSFLVSNHLTYVDIPVYARLTGSVFIARSDMRDWPLLGYIMRTSQMLFIRRESRQDAQRAISDIRHVLERGDAMTVFAEGRCSRGLEVMPFHPALFEAAAQVRMPVHYAAVTYETPPGHPAAADSVVWWRWESIDQHLSRLLRLPYFHARVRYCEVPLATTGRKTLCRQAHLGVSKRFVPVAQGVLEELPTPDTAPTTVYGKELAEKAREKERAVQ